MEEQQCSPLINWDFYYQQEGFETLKHSLLCSTLELEAAILCAHEEISRKDEEILHLKGLLAKMIRERDEFQALVILQKDSLSAQVQIKKQPSRCTSDHPTLSHEDDAVLASLSSKECLISPPPQPSPPQSLLFDVKKAKAPPGNGKFLQAVMEAGPLLQTLLLAGPLPRWQHPPPQLNSTDIPPVAISPHASRASNQDSSSLSGKRGLVEESGSGVSVPNSKNQKTCSPIITDTASSALMVVAQP